MRRRPTDHDRFGRAGAVEIVHPRHADTARAPARRTVHNLGVHQLHEHASHDALDLGVGNALSYVGAEQRLHELVVHGAHGLRVGRERRRADRDARERGVRRDLHLDDAVTLVVEVAERCRPVWLRSVDLAGIVMRGSLSSSL